MTFALRVKAGGVLLLALAGLSIGAAAAAGAIPVAPPAVLGPALAAALVALTVVKVAAVGGGILTYVRSRA
jgi:hypothetical protein